VIIDTLLADRLLDLHVHSAASGSGALDLPTLLEVADEKGLRIGVTDHVGADYNLSTEAKLNEHLDELADYPVLRAIELELCDELPLSRGTLRRLDYVLGALHTVKVQGKSVWLGEKGRLPVETEVLVNAIVDKLVQAIEDAPIDMLAHPTLLPHALRPHAADLFDDRHLDRIGRAAAAKGVALELSGRLKLPHERAVERWLAAGARLALGSGGYSASEVGDLGWPFELLDHFRIDPERLWWAR
jgi:histidinol phosphatase-like PHP family hydrolase